MPGIFALEASFRTMLNDEEFAVVMKIVHTAPVSVNLTCFVHMEINCYYTYELDYKQMSRRNCSTIKYSNGNHHLFAQVKFFVQVTNFSGIVVNLALCHPLYCASYDNSTLFNIVSQPNSTGLIAVDIKKHLL